MSLGLSILMSFQGAARSTEYASSCWFTTIVFPLRDEAGRIIGAVAASGIMIYQ